MVRVVVIWVIVVRETMIVGRIRVFFRLGEFAGGRSKVMRVDGAVALCDILAAIVILFHAPALRTPRSPRGTIAVEGRSLKLVLVWLILFRMR